MVMAKPAELWICGCHYCTTDPAQAKKHGENCLGGPAELFVKADESAIRLAFLRAADDWQTGEWANAPRSADRIQERIANGQYVTDWLRARAGKVG
jgi:hypothetical protein